MESTLVTLLLDRSGSMAAIKDATIEAFNGFLAGLREPTKGSKGDTQISFTLLQFDSMSLDKVYVAEPIEKIVKLTDATYQPRGSTPLIDACVKTISAVDKSLQARSDRPKIVVCFQTDGQENASTTHSWDELNWLIKEKTAAGWQFNFLGVGIDSYVQAMQMGIANESTLSSACDRVSVNNAFRASALNTRRYAEGLARTTGYSVRQRLASKDAHYQNYFKPRAPDLDLTTTASSAPKANEQKESLIEEPEL